MDELLSYFKHTYSRRRRIRGREENYAPALFLTHAWNKFESETEGIARTTNGLEGWNCGPQWRVTETNRLRRNVVETNRNRDETFETNRIETTVMRRMVWAPF
ncbi:hypothetical protein RF11_00648 [Thelohanellus kitauei]|uniref:Uncharacterized protein n=1 Tax=Thelohanellus kitauei TaxID=669202 RepID=A0A0C2N0H1_THEKT|nr:hypothetical protein RF11_00648 [Thelohanellus kitauei]